jgi:hypothetical protein
MITNLQSEVNVQLQQKGQQQLDFYLTAKPSSTVLRMRTV